MNYLVIGDSLFSEKLHQMGHTVLDVHHNLSFGQVNAKLFGFAAEQGVTPDDVQCVIVGAEERDIELAREVTKFSHSVVYVGAGSSETMEKDDYGVVRADPDSTPEDVLIVAALFKEQTPPSQPTPVEPTPVEPTEPRATPSPVTEIAASPTEPQPPQPEPHHETVTPHHIRQPTQPETKHVTPEPDTPMPYPAQHPTYQVSETPKPISPPQPAVSPPVVTTPTETRQQVAHPQTSPEHVRVPAVNEPPPQTTPPHSGGYYQPVTQATQPVDRSGDHQGTAEPQSPRSHIPARSPEMSHTQKNRVTVNAQSDESAIHQSAMSSTGSIPQTVPPPQNQHQARNAHEQPTQYQHGYQPSPAAATHTKTQPVPAQNVLPRPEWDPTRDPNFAGSKWREENLQEMNQPQGTVVGIVAAKGGAGKSSVSVWLSECLTALGKSVALVDANIGQPDISKMLDLSGLTPGIAALAGGVRITRSELKDALFFKRHVGDVLVGPPQPIYVEPEPAIRALQESIRMLSHSHDFVIIDSPVATINEEIVNRCVLPAADALVVVVNPHKPTMHDTTSWLWEIARPGVRGGLKFDLSSCIGIVNKNNETHMSFELIQQYVNLISFVAAIDEAPDSVVDINNGKWRCPEEAQEGIKNIAIQLIGSKPADANDSHQRTRGNKKGVFGWLMNKIGR